MKTLFKIFRYLYLVIKPPNRKDNMKLFGGVGGSSNDKVEIVRLDSNLSMELRFANVI